MGLSTVTFLAVMLVAVPMVLCECQSRLQTCMDTYPTQSWVYWEDYRNCVEPIDCYGDADGQKTKDYLLQMIKDNMEDHSSHSYDGATMVSLSMFLGTCCLVLSLFR